MSRPGRQIDLTPLEKVRAEIVGLSYQRPDVVLISLNDRKPEWHDLYEIDVTTGTRKLVERNDQQFAGYLEDLQLRPRLAVKTLADGGGELYRRTDQGWESFLQYGQGDSLTMRPLVIEEGGNTALLLSSVGRDKAALVRVDLATGKQTVVGQSDKADVSDVWLDPRTRTPQAFGIEYLTEEFEPLTPAAAKDIEHLKSVLGPQFEVLSRTQRRQQVGCGGGRSGACPGELPVRPRQRQGHEDLRSSPRAGRSAAAADAARRDSHSRWPHSRGVSDAAPGGGSG